jgi:mRNA-degrading endonuclease toxin of MazEF toxin-antitoxin module
MKSFKHGDIVLVDFENSKQNSHTGHAVVISTDVVNENLQTVIVCPLIEAKQVTKSRIGATLIPKEVIGMEENCLAFSLQLKTVAKDRIIKRISSLPADYMQQIKESIHAVLELD